jgi:hypothetical protein
VRAIEFRTASGLDFGVLVDRAFDIAWFRYLGRSVAWHSPTGFVGPWYREPEGLGFLRSFQGGFLVTGGLDHILLPEEDSNDNYGYPGRSGGTTYGLHGRVSTTPALLRAYGESWVEDRFVLFAEGEVRQAGALAENLVLRRRVEVDLFGRTVTWTDEVTNEGYQPTPHMFLYHINIGAPLLGPTSELVLPESGSSGDPGGEARLTFPAPTRGFAEEVRDHALLPDPEGAVTVALLNESPSSPSWGVALTYEHVAFPHFLEWRYFDEGTYVLGLEPATNGVGGRAAARRDGSLIVLQSGDSRRYRTQVRILDGAAECAEARIAAFGQAGGPAPVPPR